MTDIPGKETIRNLVGEPPPEIKVDHGSLAKVQVAIQAVNHVYMALLPYCFKCKAPLIWHQQPMEEGHKDELFTCPSCGRVWVKGEGWEQSTLEP